MLHVHRAERSDRLAEALADVLRVPPADPFAPEVVAVPARGVERWLTQRLSHVLGAAPGEGGVCAVVRFPSPRELVMTATTAAAGVPADEDPWEPSRLLWTLLATIDDCADEAWCATLGSHLGPVEGGERDRRGRRLAAASHLTGLFTSYGAARPEMVQAWAAGDDVDGAGAALGADLTWQAELWRRLRRAVGTPSPAERLDDTCATLRVRPDVVDLPSRLSLFGPTRLTAEQLAVLAALAAGRDVHLWLPHPSPALWDAVRPLLPAATAPTAAAEARVRPRRRTDPTAAGPRHPLLASLGRDVRELQVQLAASGAELDEQHHPLPPRPATLLGRLQDDLSADRPPPGPPRAGEPDARPMLAHDDATVQVHACHGPGRQVEVLREVLLGLLADDPTLEPRDVLVMCPDVEVFAPLVSAAFGLAPAEGDDDRDAPEHPGHRLRVRLADRSLRQTNPLLATLAQLLELADARVTASQVLDLAAAEPVRRRFRLDDDELERLREWVAESGVRWGLDADHRAPFGLHRVGQGTWQAGLDRILLGAAMAEDDQRYLATALPLDDVDSGDVDLAGRVAELVDRLSAVLRDLSGVRPVEEWVATLRGALDTLTAVRDVDGWQVAQATRELGEVTGHDSPGAPLSLPDVRALLADRLRGRPTRANFRTGSLTVCTLVPMRSVPHRVVCLLGLDDGVFPRSGAPDGDDVLARDPCVGERDPRLEDRQLLLDAVMAAQEHLVVLYSGADERTGASRPPAVPLGELLEVVDATARAADGGPGRQQVVVRHPLQPFDARNFTAGLLRPAGPFSFDRRALTGARTATEPRREADPFLTAPLHARGDDDVALDDLVAFLEHPVRGFLRQRLELSLLADEDEVEDDLAVTLDPLQRWAVGDRLLTARLAGHDPDACVAAERRRGQLPPGPLGARVLDEVGDQVEPLVVASAPLRVGDPAAFDVTVALAGGGRLSGTVGGVHGDVVVRVLFSRLAAKHKLRAWVQLLALTACRPDVAWRAATVARDPGGAGAATCRLGPLDAARASELLEQLVALRARGLCEPLPLATKTSAAYAQARLKADEAAARTRAAKAWEGSGDYAGESADKEHVAVWGEPVPFDVLAAAPPEPDERADGVALDERTRFGLLARRLWDPLQAAEREAAS